MLKRGMLGGVGINFPLTESAYPRRDAMCSENIDLSSAAAAEAIPHKPHRFGIFYSLRFLD